MKNKSKIIGILGGMGPYATVDLFKKIIDMTPIEKEKDHLRIIVDNNPKIPSRGRYFAYGEESPVFEMTATAKNLEKAGADFLIIACNQAHHFYDDVQSQIKIPILNIIEEACKYVKNELPNIKKVAVVGAKSTCEIVYKNTLEKYGFIPIIPENNDYKKLRKIIDAIKMGKKDKRLLLKICNKLIERGAEAIILGCTEFPIILRKKDLPIPTFDPNWIISKKAIEIAMAKN